MSKLTDEQVIEALEQALEEPELRSSVALGILARNMTKDIGLAKTILLLAEQTRRMIDLLVEDEETKAILKKAIIEDLGQDSTEDLTKDQDELN